MPPVCRFARPQYAEIGPILRPQFTEEKLLFHRVPEADLRGRAPRMPNR